MEEVRITSFIDHRAPPTESAEQLEILVKVTVTVSPFEKMAPPYPAEQLEISDEVTVMGPKSDIIAPPLPFHPTLELEIVDVVTVIGPFEKMAPPNPAEQLEMLDAITVTVPVEKIAPPLPFTSLTCPFLSVRLSMVRETELPAARKMPFSLPVPSMMVFAGLPPAIVFASIVMLEKNLRLFTV